MNKYKPNEAKVLSNGESMWNSLGSTSFVTDDNATLTQGFLYAPHGEIGTEYNAGFGSNLLPKRAFNGKELDEETGFYYCEARYYHPQVFPIQWRTCRMCE